MRDHLPVILFLVPFATAICLPMVGLKAHGWCRPLALVSLLVGRGGAADNKQAAFMSALAFAFLWETLP